ncbi:MAG: M24 family metallopeptidase [Lachnospiraceae bacterium]|nr:M24 family metallopeptidase [Lachnospiraceae bacterium]
MALSLFEKAKYELKENGLDAYYFNLSNEHLYEFTKLSNNYLIELTGFTGDTGSLLVTRGKSYLFVDGRFTIQVKKEVKNSKIKIVEVRTLKEKITQFKAIMKKGSVIGFNPKVESIKNVLEIGEELGKCEIKFLPKEKFLQTELIESKKYAFKLTSAPLFVLNKKYVSETPKTKIKNLKSNLKDSANSIYITSSLEEIAYITNLRYALCDISDYNVLFDAFMIVDDKKTILYVKDYLDERSEKYLYLNGIIVKQYSDFYSDLGNYVGRDFYLDKRLNNYFIYTLLRICDDKHFINSPLEVPMSQKGKAEIAGLEKANLYDGIAMVKVLYALKEHFTVRKNKKIKFDTEYDIKQFVDKTRREVSGKNYLCNSFETIVAYRDNSAICHYVPKKDASKKVKSDSLLLIDSGGNYIFGTTDITRTISLYKSKKQIPEVVKKHYTLVLNSLFSLYMQKFPYGTKGSEIDIIARQNLYNEYLDFNHGTGHGIGFISNVHEGPNTISPSAANKNNNTLEVGQVTSNEPGLYFEKKYGIRLENDMLTVLEKETNLYGDFLGFRFLTLCPFDIDLIDRKYLDDKIIVHLNEYNKMVYNKLHNHLNSEEEKWLKSVTREVK